MAETSFSVLSPRQDLEEWDRFVSRSPQGTLFCKSWWLKAAFLTSFEVLVARRAGAIIAGIPLPYVGSGKRRRVVRPPMTTTMGVLLDSDQPSSTRYEKQLSAEMSLLVGLVAAIPDNSGFRASFHPTFQNWLPFYWHRYQQVTSYTYVLDNIGDIDAVVAGMNHSKRKNLKRARKLVTVEREMDTVSFFRHHKGTLGKEGRVISYRLDDLKRVLRAVRLHANAEILSAVDSDGVIHSAIIVIYDEASAYYIASSIDPDFRNSGSVTLLLVEAIRVVSGTTNRFDFEGSMSPGVERSFRKFGARQTPYFEIFKNEGWRPRLSIALERVARKIGIKE